MWLVSDATAGLSGFRPNTRRPLLPKFCYQLDLVTPGKRPTDASSRKQIRQTPNFRMYARPLPQVLQRFTCRVWNFAGRLARTI